MSKKSIDIDELNVGIWHEKTDAVLASATCKQCSTKPCTAGLVAHVTEGGTDVEEYYCQSCKFLFLGSLGEDD